MTKKRELHISTGDLDRFGREFVDTWRSGERAQAHEAEHESIYFTDVGTLAKVLSHQRVRLLRDLQQHPRSSIYALARRLKRDYKNVHGDVALLKRVGLVIDDDGLSVPYTKIHAEIDLAA